MIAYKVKYFPGSLNVNQTASFSAEVIANIAAGVLASKFRPKYIFTGLFSVSAVAALLILFIGEEAKGAFVFMVLLAKFGITAAFCIVYVAHPKMFPTLFSVTSMGIVNIISRGVSVFAPMVAEVEYPVPMLTFTALCIASAIAALFLIET